MEQPLLRIDKPPGLTRYSTRGLDAEVRTVRDELNKKGEMAVGKLCYAGLQHAAEGITHSARTLCKLWTAVSDTSRRQHFYEEGRGLARDVTGWVQKNKCKALFLFLGFGGLVYNSATIKGKMKELGIGYMEWSQETTRLKRFAGFCAVMTVRLIVSTLVPPTSPGFSIIVKEGTPQNVTLSDGSSYDESWTAMPLFLAASTVAGCVPYLLDKIFQLITCLFCGKPRDFLYTTFMKRLVDAWPLTCWTGPAMLRVFEAVDGGKIGASLAVIVAHAAPFMGAQTTNIQRYFLPHPLDTIISQPFGMSEDLLAIAFAQAGENPKLASISITGLICGFNLLAYVVFSRCEDTEAFVSFLFNLGVGFLAKEWVASHGLKGKAAFEAIGVQIMVQIFIVPVINLVIFMRANRAKEKLQQGNERLSKLQQDNERLEKEKEKLQQDNERLEKEKEKLQQDNDDSLCTGYSHLAGHNLMRRAQGFRSDSSDDDDIGIPWVNARRQLPPQRILMNKVTMSSDSEDEQRGQIEKLLRARGRGGAVAHGGALGRGPTSLSAARTSPIAAQSRAKRMLERSESSDSC